MLDLVPVGNEDIANAEERQVLEDFIPQGAGTDHHDLGSRQPLLVPPADQIEAGETTGRVIGFELQHSTQEAILLAPFRLFAGSTKAASRLGDCTSLVLYRTCSGVAEAAAPAVISGCSLKTSPSLTSAVRRVCVSRSWRPLAL